MPNVGDIVKGNVIGRTGYAAKALFILRSCPDCGKEEWVAARGGKPSKLRCITCGYKKAGDTHHKNSVPPPKGTVDNPCIGDIRRGKEIGRTTSGQEYFIYIQCPICNNKRWAFRWCVKQSSGKGTCHRCTLTQRNKERHGDKSANWKGGTRIWRGYRTIYIPSNSPYYPMATQGRSTAGGYILEHRLVMAKHLGRLLHPWEAVHHKNHIKDDNRIENLELMPRVQHEGITQIERRVSILETESRKQTRLIKLLIWHISQLNNTREIV